MEWHEHLENLLRPQRNIAVLGIGNEMMGDDAAGVLLVRELRKLTIGRTGTRTLHLFETHTTPENFTGAIERLEPDAVLMIDSAEMGAPVGEVRVLDAATMGSMMHSTHTMPLSFLAGYIERTTGAKVFAIGIQAGHIMLDQPMSREVAVSVKRAARVIAYIMCGSDRKVRTIKGTLPGRKHPKHRK
jgi:hydrogenase 3 maturation protease